MIEFFFYKDEVESEELFGLVIQAFRNNQYQLLKPLCEAYICSRGKRI